MADVKDILGVSRVGARPDVKKEKERVQRPAGMSREAFALLDGSHPIVPSLAGDLRKKSDLQGLKEKRNYKGTVAWRWQEFANSGRGDSLRLSHWTKCFKDTTGKVKLADSADYRFAKYNKKILVHQYNDEEWENVIAKDPAWSREETDYLLDLCHLLQLRFLVITDKYEFPGSKPEERTMEDLKARYYSIARQLMIAREGNQEDIENRILIRAPFDANHEKERKRAALMLLKRTPQEEAEENAILEEAKVIEAGRKALESAQNAAPTAASPKPGIPAEPQSMADYTAAVPPGTPSLLAADLQPSKPAKPGVICRRAFTAAQAQLQVASISGGARTDSRTDFPETFALYCKSCRGKQLENKSMGQKIAEATFGDLNVADPPKMGSRAVCATWLALRSEIIHMLDLKSKLSNLQRAGTPASSDTRKRPPKLKTGRVDDSMDVPKEKRPRTAKKYVDD